MREINAQLTYSKRHSRSIALAKAEDSGINKPCAPKSVLQVLLRWLMPQPFFLHTLTDFTPAQLMRNYTILSKFCAVDSWKILANKLLQCQYLSDFTDYFSAIIVPEKIVIIFMFTDPSGKKYLFQQRLSSKNSHYIILM